MSTINEHIKEYVYNDTLEKIILDNFIENATIRVNFSWDNSVESVSLYLHNYELKTIIDNSANFQLDDRLKFGNSSLLKKYKIKELLDDNQISHDLSYHLLCTNYPMLKPLLKEIYHNLTIKNLLKIYENLTNPEIHMDYNVEFITNENIIDELNNVDYFGCESPSLLKDTLEYEYNKYNNTIVLLDNYTNINTFSLKQVKKHHVYYSDVEYYIINSSNISNLYSLIETAYGFNASELIFSLFTMFARDEYIQSLDNTINTTSTNNDTTDVDIPEIGILDYMHKYNTEHQDDENSIKYMPTLGLDIEIQHQVEDIIDSYAYSMKQENKLLELVKENKDLEKSLILLEEKIKSISEKYLTSLEKYESLKYELELNSIISEDNDEAEHTPENNHKNILLNKLKSDNNDLFFKLEELESERYYINKNRITIITELIGKIPLDLKNVSTIALQDNLEDKLNGINNVRNIAYYRRNYSTNYYDSSYLLNVLEGESQDG